MSVQNIFFCLLTILAISGRSQSVGINNNGSLPHQSAQLDVNSNSKGVLVPRVALTNRNVAAPIQNPANSLMVYNTATAGTGNIAVAPGFYFWNNGSWIPIGLNSDAGISGKNDVLAQDSVGRIGTKKGYGAQAINFIISLYGVFPSPNGPSVYEYPMIGEIKLYAGDTEPNGWAFCNGQELPISENDALFTLLGTTYGGDGESTFALPDLRSAVALHFGISTSRQTWTFAEKKD